MAKRDPIVYLGYEGEVIVEKNVIQLNYTVNKIGGKPNWPPLSNINIASKCPLCSLHRILLVQCYAPLENSIYHRTLYVFACINPNCWIQSESWSCIRCQVQEEKISTEAFVAIPNESNLSWCQGSDDWDSNDNCDSNNGNLMNVDNAQSLNNQRASDEEDESNSLELETVEQAMGNLQVFDAHNANLSPVQGAVGAVGAPIPKAELEGGDESDLVIVEKPTSPTNNMEALLNQTAELSPDVRSRLVCGPLEFVPKYIYVEQEWRKSMNNDERVTELLNKYKKENEIEVGNVAEGGAGGSEEETYEETVPLHGDKLFHAFLTRIHDNPGQILRYSRDAPPLLGAPLQIPASSMDSRIPSCTRCGSTLTCELQLVPAFSETLSLVPNIPISHLHFLSVLIFTCSRSCWQANDSFVEETVIFQPEVI
ncbi:programmed cell death protein 2-like [Aricia agestis]|uniref:programmed cell death protein 2-like n=1 Tax=Aricia agestis TaxID=91739 RepID=UPI001C207CBD|nr:programmed cell death protein 2-like [Aricia agestis]